MLDRRYIEENPDAVRAMLTSRRHDFDLDDLLARLARRKELRGKLEELQTRRNAGSKEVGGLFKQGKRDEAEALRAELSAIGDQVAAGEAEVKAFEAELDYLMLSIPNRISPDSPDGADESANAIVRTWGEKRELDFEPQDHHTLGENLGILDFERGAKVTGARFTFLRAGAAKLNRALMSFLLDLHTEQHGYTELVPPFMVNDRSLTGTSQLPKFEEDLFRLNEPDNYYLIPTAEVPVTNFYAGEILDGASLPQRFCAYTPCFRAEAGSYGRDTRGLIRQHQFEKVEMVQFVRPEDSDAAHEELTGHAERALQLLGLHYQTVVLSTGDTSFGAYKCYDIEVWLPGMKAYREVSSCSNFKDFQARRANIRFRPEPKTKPQFLHTLNGSGLPLGRTLVAIIEQYQQADGSIAVPEVLQPYMRGVDVIR